ncbi:major facilitator superfamily domain-containing protein [Xylaria bambusicola]|uniref:major facilitator superfamily domain-containing protein n=1 Tax=Xylaria bambusicola TaxID=326684 RepID=UPI0020075F02|nr:major facilitator superfamily domain-containing protein [Xylaria bambusicola]KAI0517350.1 major facilitator superfamily domain-containing protein [Xylaria bambusicola]
MMAHHYEEYRLSSLDLLPEENVEESSNRLLMEETGVESQTRTKSNYEMLILTLSLAGLQSAYCSQFADGTDYLMSIGISPTVIASIWIIPPLCGATFQPLFGILSDALKAKLGRREPLLLLGGLGLLCALIIQAWSSTIANGLDGSCQGAWPACWTKVFVAIFAVVMLYASAQAVQVATRTKMVDMCPASQQLKLNTLASRLISLTSVLYYILSYGLPPLATVELRMQELALISVIISVGTISIASVEGWESLPHSPPKACSSMATPGEGSYIQRVKDSVTTRMFKILAVQFLSSFAWFPYLFFISRHITEKGHTEGNTTERLGPLALFLQSVVHLITTFALPFLASHTARDTLPSTKALGFLHFEPLQIWRLSQVLYSVCVAGILLTKSTAFALLLAALIGFSWAVMQIIPYTILTDEFLLKNGGEPRRLNSSGLFLGINNLSMTIPQIIAGVICTTIFSTVSEKHTESMFNGMTGSLAIGSMVSLLATVVSFCIL